MMLKFVKSKNKFLVLISGQTKNMSRFISKVKKIITKKGGDGDSSKPKKEKITGWKSEKSYTVGDKVKFHGKKYVCQTAHTSSRTETPWTVPSKWSVIESLKPDTTVPEVPPADVKPVGPTNDTVDVPVQDPIKAQMNPAINPNLTPDVGNINNMVDPSGSLNTSTVTRTDGNTNPYGESW